MENVTLGQIQGIFVWLIAFGGSVASIYLFLQKGMKKLLQPIYDKIDKVDLNATMNYLVSRLDEIDKGTKLDGVAKKRFIDEYEHYTKDLKGNTYIHDEFERLKSEKKI